MTKYALSQHISITAIADYGLESVPEKFHTDHFVVYDERKGRDYLINPTIKYFLDKFSTPQALDEVIESVKKELNTDSHEVEQICHEFFEFLLRKKIITIEGVVNKIVEQSLLFEEGDTVDGFRIQNLISNRKEVVLYKVSRQDANADFVLKILLKSKTKDEELYKNETGWLEREHVLLKRMEHIPEMCKTFLFHKKDEFAYIQLEYIVGKSLTEFLENTGDWNLNGALTLLRRIISPFASMHQSDLIHGDIHSSNILVKENREIKIIDLGFSSLAELEKNQLMKSGGVTFYMPPERINLSSIKKYKSSSASLRSDVYQLGMLMFLTVYNILPFSGFIWEDLATNIQTEAIDFAPVSFAGFPVPENLIIIMKKSLERNPNDRYANAAVLLSDFDNHFFSEKESVLN